MYLFTNPPAQAGCDTQAILNRILPGLDSEFLFSLTDCLTKTEEHCLPYYLPLAGVRMRGFILFPRALWNAIELFQDLNTCRRDPFLRR